MANLINLNAAGIDVASKIHYVAVPSDRDKKPVRNFGSFTNDLHKIAQWLKKCKIDTVAMESTGVYWYHLYVVLTEYGFDVQLVNAHHVKNVPGRKSDVEDAQWLQQLHSYGLLKGCFQPDNLTRELREYVRNRQQLIKSLTQQTQRMQKALELMNIKLNNVIRDINGKTGRSIIKAIIDGERRPEELAKHRDPRIEASYETVKESLIGNWSNEQLFNLKMAFNHYEFIKKQINEYDLESEKAIKKMENSNINKKKIISKRKQKNQPKFNLEQLLYNAYGVDITEIPGLKSTNALIVLSEIGTDIKSKFPTEKQFLSWCNVVPDNKISGGKLLSSKVKKKKNKTGQAFRNAASTLWNAKSPLGDYLRKKKNKTGSSSKAIVATARKIASIFYQMVTNGEEFDMEKLKKNQEEYILKKMIYFEKKLEELKMIALENESLANCVI